MVAIGFSTSQHWYSRIIRWATKATCSHTFIIYSSLDAGCNMVLEAANVGFRPIPLTHWSEMGNQLLVCYQLKNIDLMPQVNWALNTLVGEDYNWSGLFGMAWVTIGKWFKRKWKNPGLSANANFCSEANAILLTRAKVPGFNLDPGETSPEDLMEWCQKSPECKQVIV